MGVCELDEGIDNDIPNNPRCNRPTHIIEWPIITIATKEPAVAQGNISQSAKKHPIYRFELRRDAYPGDVELKTLSFTTSGNATAVDISKFQLWSSAIYDSLHLASHVSADITSDLAAGVHSFNSIDISLFPSNTRYFWITADLNEQATIDRSLAVNALTADNITLDFSNTADVIKKSLAYSGGTQTIVGMNTELSTVNQVPAQGISIGSANNPIYHFQLRPSGSNTLTQLSVKGDGISNSAFKNFRLYGSLTDSFASAVQIGEYGIVSTQMGQTYSEIGFFNLTHPLFSGQKHYFWITADVNDGDNVSGAITIDAIDSAKITLVGSISTVGTISAGGTQTIVPPATTLASAEPAIGVATISVGSKKNPFYAFNLKSAGANVLQKVTIVPIGLNLSTNVTKYQLYSSTLNSFSTANQVGADITSIPASGDITFTGLNHPLTDGITRYFWVTADISGDATVENTIQVAEFTTANFVMATGDKAGTAYPGAVQTIGYPLLTVKTSNPAIPEGTVNMGQEVNPIYRFSVERGDDSGTATINKISFIIDGTYAVNSSMFKLRKSMVDNCATAQDVDATVTQGSGADSKKFSFTLATPLSIAPNSTQYFWISVSTTNAGEGQTIQVLALEANNFEVTDARKHFATYNGSEQVIGEVTVSLSSGSYALDASIFSPGQVKRPLQSFSLQSCGNVTLNRISFSTDGTYSANDITRLQLWTGTENDFSAAGQIGADIAPGTHEFTDIGMTLVPSQPHYFWITADASASATISNTINVSALTTSNISVSSGTVAGSTLAGGVQTFALSEWTFSRGQTISQIPNVDAGFQVKVIVHRTNVPEDGMNVFVDENCRNDFGDIRFYEGDLPLSYWIESIDHGVKATFWVKLNGSLSIAPIDLTLRYGNEGVTTTSDGTATFEFFDDFNRGDNSLIKWNEHKTEDDSSIFIPRGLNHVRLGDSTITGSFGHVVLGSDKTYSNFTNGTIEFKYRVSVDAIAEVGLRGNFFSNTGYKARSDARNTLSVGNGGQSFLTPPYYDWGHMIDSPDPFLYQPVPHTWYHGMITASGNNLVFYRDGQQYANTAQATSHAAGEISLQNHYGNKVDFDYIFVRKYADIEPVRSAWRGVPVALQATAINYNGFTARWKPCAEAVSYKLSVYESDGYTEVEGWWNTLNVTTTAARVDGLDSNKTYKYSVKSICINGYYSPSSNTIIQATSSVLPGAGASTSIEGEAITVYIPPVTASGSTVNNDVIMLPEVSAADDFYITISYHPTGYDIWPNGRLLATITSTNVAALNGTYTFNYEGMTMPQAAAYRWDNEWYHLDANFGENSSTLTIAGISSNRSNGALEIIFDDGSGTLPVELSSFTARLNPYGKVKIEWVTQTETNVMGYRLYRNNIKNLDEALLLDALIEGRNSSHTQVYTYIDNDVLTPGNQYYWLECMDYDGTMQYYGPVTVKISGDSDSHNQAPIIAGINHTYPNPFNPDIHIAFGVPEESTVKLTIYNIKGQFVSEILNENFKRGNHTFTWTGRDARGRQLSSGLYFLRMEMDRKTWIKKIVMSK